MTRSQQRPSWLIWQSVALDSPGREFDSHRTYDRRPWSCIFRNCMVSRLKSSKSSEICFKRQTLHVSNLIVN